MTPTQIARRLFSPIAPSYEKWAALLSMGQDARWRRVMVDGLEIEPGSLVLDVAAGTGSITRLLEAREARVVALDQSMEMLSQLRHATGLTVDATAERLPFADATFDAVTTGYLLRYVDDVAGCLAELARVLRPGGWLGVVEFSRPSGMWKPLWDLYTRALLPAAGRLIGSGWEEVGRFLGPNIAAFVETWPQDRLRATATAAGIDLVEIRRLSLGGGMVVWGQRT